MRQRKFSGRAIIIGLAILALIVFLIEWLLSNTINWNFRRDEEDSNSDSHGHHHSHGFGRRHRHGSTTQPACPSGQYRLTDDAECEPIPQDTACPSGQYRLTDDAECEPIPEDTACAAGLMRRTPEGKCKVPDPCHEDFWEQKYLGLEDEWRKEVGDDVFKVWKNHDWVYNKRTPKDTSRMDYWDLSALNNPDQADCGKFLTGHAGGYDASSSTAAGPLEWINYYSELPEATGCEGEAIRTLGSEIDVTKDILRKRYAVCFSEETSST